MNINIFIFIVAISAILAAISVDKFLFDWGILGTAGLVGKEILRSISLSLFTASIMWIFVQRKSTEQIRSLLQSPETIFGRVTKENFPSYICSYFYKQFGSDQSMVKSMFNIISKRIIEPSEYWENVDTKIVIPAVTDDNGYKRIRVSREYTIKSSSRKKLRFCCKFSGNRDQQIHENDFEISWTFLPSPGENRLPIECFKMIDLKINDRPIRFQRLTNDEDPDYIEYMAESDLLSLNESKIYYSFEVMQSMYFGFVSIHLKRMCHEFSSTLNFSEASEIKDVWASTSFLNDGHIREIRDIPRSITVKADGWVLPKGATFFSWNNIN